MRGARVSASGIPLRGSPDSGSRLVRNPRAVQVSRGFRARIPSTKRGMAASRAGGLSRARPVSSPAPIARHGVELLQ